MRTVNSAFSRWNQST